ASSRIYFVRVRSASEDAGNRPAATAVGRNYGGYNHRDPRPQRRIPMLKRLMDFCGAAIAMVALFPLLICAAITIRLTMGRPVFFHQIRPGYFEKPFTIYKFRTMLKGNDALGNPLPDADRLHPVGSFLRR